MSQTDADAVPLVAAVKEFNAMHNKSVDGKRQPPLTVSEVLAAIVDANFHRDDFAIDNATFERSQQIARTHQLPAGCKLELLPSFGTLSGDRFNIWSVRIVMPQAAKPGWTYAFEIRKQYVSMDSPNDSKIYWGKPNVAGLQAGFRLIPSQRMYQGAQQVETEFFYRSISSDPISATLPNVFSHHELIAKDTAGKPLDVVEVKERTIGGAVQTEIGDQPVRRGGRSLSLAYITPDPEFDLYENQPAETFLTIRDGQKVFLQYVVSDLDGGTLTTGILAIDIADRADNAGAKADANDVSGGSTRPQFSTSESTRREEGSSNSFLDSLTKAANKVGLAAGNQIKLSNDDDDCEAELKPTPEAILESLAKREELEPKSIVGLYEKHCDDLTFRVEKFKDETLPDRVYPLIGPALRHRIHYKCTVSFTETIEASWPIPHTTKDRREEIVYIGMEHLHRAESPDDPAARDDVRKPNPSGQRR